MQVVKAVLTFNRPLGHLITSLHCQERASPSKQSGRSYDILARKGCCIELQSEVESRDGS